MAENIYKKDIEDFFELEAEESKARWEATMKLSIEERIRKRKAIYPAYLDKDFSNRSDEGNNLLYDDYGHEKYRVQFIYNGIHYDFPLTDTRYINELRSRTKACGERNTGDLYLTLSLGVNHYDWHYKLVAGVIDLAS